MQINAAFDKYGRWSTARHPDQWERLISAQVDRMSSVIEPWLFLTSHRIESHPAFVSTPQTRLLVCGKISLCLSVWPQCLLYYKHKAYQFNNCMWRNGFKFTGRYSSGRSVEWLTASVKVSLCVQDERSPAVAAVSINAPGFDFTYRKGAWVNRLICIQIFVELSSISCKKKIVETVEICYDDLGCIVIDDSWYDTNRPFNLEPLSREKINTRFILKTRELPNRVNSFKI